jgi:hypothetical protein
MSSKLFSELNKTTLGYHYIKLENFMAGISTELKVFHYYQYPLATTVSKKM